jgi:sulfur-oxidizing protein SoxZ
MTISEDMDSGVVRDSRGELVPAHFIRQFAFGHDDKPVFDATDTTTAKIG